MSNSEQQHHWGHSIVHTALRRQSPEKADSPFWGRHGLVSAMWRRSDVRTLTPVPVFPIYCAVGQHKAPDTCGSLTRVAHKPSIAIEQASLLTLSGPLN